MSASICFLPLEHASYFCNIYFFLIFFLHLIPCSPPPPSGMNSSFTKTSLNCVKLLPPPLVSLTCSSPLQFSLLLHSITQINKQDIEINFKNKIIQVLIAFVNHLSLFFSFLSSSLGFIRVWQAHR